MEADVIERLQRKGEGDTDSSPSVASSSPMPLPSALHLPHLPHFPLKTHKPGFSHRMRQGNCVRAPDPVSDGPLHGKSLLRKLAPQRCTESLLSGSLAWVEGAW